MIKTEKSIETLTKELATLDSAELHDLFMFYYRINHQHFNLTSSENFNKFLVSFDKNPLPALPSDWLMKICTQHIPISMMR